MCVQLCLWWVCLAECMPQSQKWVCYVMLASAAETMVCQHIHFVLILVSIFSRQTLHFLVLLYLVGRHCSCVGLHQALCHAKTDAVTNLTS